MRERGWIEHHRDALIGSYVQPSDEFGLVVGLSDLHGQAEARSGVGAGCGYIGQRHGAVDVRFATAETAEVGAVEHPHCDRIGTGLVTHAALPELMSS